jgi:hypothetical protein
MRFVKHDTILTIIAIAALAALLIPTTNLITRPPRNMLFAFAYAAESSSNSNSILQTSDQDCINRDARCETVLGQLQGHDNAAAVTGNQPTGLEDPCIQCFAVLTADQKAAFMEAISHRIRVLVPSFEEFCDLFFSGQIDSRQLSRAFFEAHIPRTTISEITACLRQLTP